MPPEGSQLYAELYNGGNRIWPHFEHQLDDLRIALTSSDKKQAPPHPLRFVRDAKRSGWGDPQRISKLRDAQRRARQRRRELARQEA